MDRLTVPIEPQRSSIFPPTLGTVAVPTDLARGYSAYEALTREPEEDESDVTEHQGTSYFDLCVNVVVLFVILILSWLVVSRMQCRSRPVVLSVNCPALGGPAQHLRGCKFAFLTVTNHHEVVGTWFCCPQSSYFTTLSNELFHSILDVDGPFSSNLVQKLPSTWLKGFSILYGFLSFL